MIFLEMGHSVAVSLAMFKVLQILKSVKVLDIKKYINRYNIIIILINIFLSAPKPAECE